MDKAIRIIYHVVSPEKEKIMKQLIYLLSAVLLLTLVFQGCGGSDSKTKTPSDVSNLAATSKNGKVTLTWQDPTDANFSDVEITWTPNGYTIQSVLKGGQTYIAAGLTNDTEYTFTIKALYEDGKISNGVTATATPSVGDIYVAGSDSGLAAVWKNWSLTQLTAEGRTGATAYSVVVFGGDVYVAGIGFDSNGSHTNPYVATVWKNKDVLYSTDGTLDASANSLFLSVNDIYSAGYENSVKLSNYSVAKVWKNGISDPSTGLTDGSLDAAAYSVFISWNDVYVAGYEPSQSRDHSVATVWINGTPNGLSDVNQDAEAYSVIVVGDDYYTSGYQSNGNKKIATVWKNTSPKYLTDGTQDAEAYTVAVSGDNVYAAGYVSNGTRNVATIWKNGNPTNLSDGNQGADARSLALIGEDVYVAGNDGNNAKVWKNGTVLQTINNSFASSLFIVPK